MVRLRQKDGQCRENSTLNCDMKIIFLALLLVESDDQLLYTVSR